jgi:hypothetical protein
METKSKNLLLTLFVLGFLIFFQYSLNTPFENSQNIYFSINIITGIMGGCFSIAISLVLGFIFGITKPSRISNVAIQNASYILIFIYSLAALSLLLQYFFPRIVQD